VLAPSTHWAAPLEVDLVQVAEGGVTHAMAGQLLTQFCELKALA